jgi:hypothetical protein
MKNIYVLTVMQLGDEQCAIKRSRTWGWFPDLAEAEKVVRSNAPDIYANGAYTTAVVEEMGAGPLTLATSEHWYRAKRIKPGGIESPGTYEVEPIDKPELLRGIVGFGMG